MILVSKNSNENVINSIKSIEYLNIVMHYSLDQFQTFLAVVDHGGFAAAARELGRSQSSITYAIRALEEQTGLILFDRAHYRPQLTSAGKALLPRARRLVEDLQDFHAQASGFAQGVEAALTLVVNEFADMEQVIAALTVMHKTFPGVGVKLVRKSFGDDLEMVRQGQAQLGVVAGLGPMGNEIEAHFLGEGPLIAVAAPVHPLAQKQGALALEDVRGHMQIVWTREGALAGDPDFGVHALDAWHVTELDTKRRLLLAGIGWGSMPLHLVQQEIDQGRLVRLTIQSWEGSDRMPVFPAFVIRQRKAVQGPAARCLMQALMNSAQEAQP